MDKHLNCFYSYNQDNELIENNLTRSFIVTLLGMSGETRNSFFSLLSSTHPEFSAIDFSNAHFALQNNIECNPMDFKKKCIITLATDTVFFLEQNIRNIGSEPVKQTLNGHALPTGISQAELDTLRNLRYASIPDAWIYDKTDRTYCYLVECKKETARIDYAQIIRHAYEKFGFDSLDVIDSCITRLTWYDVLESLVSLVEQNRCVNEQERFLIDSLIDYMGFVGYHRFRGLGFNKMKTPPTIGFLFPEEILTARHMLRFNDVYNHLRLRLLYIIRGNLINLTRQVPAPQLRLHISAATEVEKALFRISNLCLTPSIGVKYRGG